jgi:hypothetical protein
MQNNLTAQLCLVSPVTSGRNPTIIENPSALPILDAEV